MGQLSQSASSSLLGRWSLATPPPNFPPSPISTQLEVYRPPAGVKVSGRSAVTLRVMTRTSTVLLSGPQWSPSPKIRAKVSYGQAPPQPRFLLGPDFKAASKAGKGRSPYRSLPASIAALLLLWMKGQGSVNLTCVPLSGAQCDLAPPGPELEQARRAELAPGQALSIHASARRGVVP